MSELNKSYRIRTEVGGINSKETTPVVNVQLSQTYDMLEILSLKLSTKDTYKYYNSSYGVIVGRVIANGGFGVPNAKISIFIERDIEDSASQSLLYGYTSPTSYDTNGVRYNLLPDMVDEACHQNIGTFPNKRLVLDNDDIIEVFEKYWKYTTTTNNSGDYMLFGVPTGNQQLHVDLDLSDCGVLSQRPRDLIAKGYNANLFDSPTKFKKSTSLNSLAQVYTQDRGIYVYPYWGEESDSSETIAITRCDINVEYKFEPYAVFMGSVVTDKGGNAIGKNCAGTDTLGKMSDLATGEGSIEMIRKTPDGLVEQHQIRGDRLIDGDGVWCYPVPMNLDYVRTDEFGNLVPTEDPSKGIPTRARVRFRITMDDSPNDATARKRCRYLVPNNPSFDEDLYPEFCATKEADYEFGTNTREESYCDMFWNKVYTVKNYIPRLQSNDKETNRRHTGIKLINHYGDNNPMPYNSLSIKLSFSHRLICVLTKFIIYMIEFINFILGAIALPFCVLKTFLDKIGKLFCFSILGIKPLCWVTNLLIKPLIKLCEALIIDCLSVSNEFCDDGINNNVYYPGCGTGMAKVLNAGITSAEKCHWEEGTKRHCAKKQHGASEPAMCINDTDQLMTCIENQLAQDNDATSFNFANDWMNGVLYLPLWYRKIVPKKKFLFGLFSRKAKDDWCDANLYFKDIRLFQTCALPHKNQGSTKNLQGKSVQVKNMDCSGYGDCNDSSQKCQKLKGVIQGMNGLIVTTTDMLGRTVYYYKSVEVSHSVSESYELTDANGSVNMIRMFASDIVLLGSFNDCDINGIPQFYKELECTTYNMPTDILFTNNEISFRTDSEGNWIQELKSTTEMTGCDWGNKNEFGVSDGGLFYGIGCSAIEMAPKSCANLIRICELGVSLDETKTIPNLYRLSGGDKSTSDADLLIADGYVSFDELYGSDARAMFATLNGNKLRKQQNNTNGLYEYVFRHLYPNNFDGGLKTNMQRRTQSYRSDVSYRNNYNLELTNNDYFLFRMGDKPYYYLPLNTLPRYENSFYFYFGLKQGKTAIDKFNSLYTAECSDNSQDVAFQIKTQYKANSWCSEVGDNIPDGYVAIDVTGISTPYDLQLNSKDGIPVSYHYPEMTSEKICFGEQSAPDGDGWEKMPVVLTNGQWEIVLTDSDGNISTGMIYIRGKYLSFDATPKSFVDTNAVLAETHKDTDSTGDTTYDYVDYSAIANHNDCSRLTDADGVIVIENIVDGNMRPLENFTISVAPSNDVDLMTLNDGHIDEDGKYKHYYKPFRATVKNNAGSITVTAYGDGYCNGSFDGKTFVIGVPKGGISYKVTITELCGDQENMNIATKNVVVKEPIPFKMFINNIDYDMIRLFNSDWTITGTASSANINKNTNFNPVDWLNFAQTKTDLKDKASIGGVTVTSKKNPTESTYEITIAKGTRTFVFNDENPLTENESRYLWEDDNVSGCKILWSVNEKYNLDYYNFPDDNVIKKYENLKYRIKDYGIAYITEQSVDVTDNQFTVKTSISSTEGDVLVEYNCEYNKNRNIVICNNNVLYLTATNTFVLYGIECTLHKNGSGDATKVTWNKINTSLFDDNLSVTIYIVGNVEEVNFYNENKFIVKTIEYTINDDKTLSYEENGTAKTLSPTGDKYRIDGIDYYIGVVGVSIENLPSSTVVSQNIIYTINGVTSTNKPNIKPFEDSSHNGDFVLGIQLSSTIDVTISCYFVGEFVDCNGYGETTLFSLDSCSDICEYDKDDNLWKYRLNSVSDLAFVGKCVEYTDHLGCKITEYINPTRSNLVLLSDYESISEVYQQQYTAFRLTLAQRREFIEQLKRAFWMIADGGTTSLSVSVQTSNFPYDAKIVHRAEENLRGYGVPTEEKKLTVSEDGEYVISPIINPTVVSDNGDTTKLAAYVYDFSATDIAGEAPRFDDTNPWRYKTPYLVACRDGRYNKLPRNVIVADNDNLSKAQINNFFKVHFVDKAFRSKMVMWSAMMDIPEYDALWYRTLPSRNGIINGCINNGARPFTTCQYDSQDITIYDAKNAKEHNIITPRFVEGLSDCILIKASGVPNKTYKITDGGFTIGGNNYQIEFDKVEEHTVNTAKIGVVTDGVNEYSVTADYKCKIGNTTYEIHGSYDYHISEDNRLWDENDYIPVLPKNSNLTIEDRNSNSISEEVYGKMSVKLLSSEIGSGSAGNLVKFTTRNADEDGLEYFLYGVIDKNQYPYQHFTATTVDAGTINLKEGVVKWEEWQYAGRVQYGYFDIFNRRYFYNPTDNKVTTSIQTTTGPHTDELQMSGGKFRTLHNAKFKLQYEHSDGSRHDRKFTIRQLSSNNKLEIIEHELKIGSLVIFPGVTTEVSNYSFVVDGISRHISHYTVSWVEGGIDKGVEITDGDSFKIELTSDKEVVSDSGAYSIVWRCKLLNSSTLKDIQKPLYKTAVYEIPNSDLRAIDRTHGGITFKSIERKGMASSDVTNYRFTTYVTCIKDVDGDNSFMWRYPFANISTCGAVSIVDGKIEFECNGYQVSKSVSSGDNCVQVELGTYEFDNTLSIFRINSTGNRIGSCIGVTNQEFILDSIKRCVLPEVFTFTYNGNVYQIEQNNNSPSAVLGTIKIDSKTIKINKFTKQFDLDGETFRIECETDKSFYPASIKLLCTQVLKIFDSAWAKGNTVSEALKIFSSKTNRDVLMSKVSTSVNGFSDNLYDFDNESDYLNNNKGYSTNGIFDIQSLTGKFFVVARAQNGCCTLSPLYEIAKPEVTLKILVDSSNKIATTKIVDGVEKIVGGIKINIGSLGGSYYRKYGTMTIDIKTNGDNSLLVFHADEVYVPFRFSAGGITFHASKYIKSRIASNEIVFDGDDEVVYNSGTEDEGKVKIKTITDGDDNVRYFVMPDITGCSIPKNTILYFYGEKVYWSETDVTGVELYKTADITIESKEIYLEYNEQVALIISNLVREFFAWVFPRNTCTITIQEDKQPCFPSPVAMKYNLIVIPGTEIVS